VSSVKEKITATERTFSGTVPFAVGVAITVPKLNFSEKGA